LNEEHARQENVTLAELKKVIADIYPGKNELYVIAFKKVEG
ncbi:ASCH domain-containing protein, partial [Cronobacter sakazakii]